MWILSFFSLCLVGLGDFHKEFYVLYAITDKEERRNLNNFGIIKRIKHILYYCIYEAQGPVILPKGQ